MRIVILLILAFQFSTAQQKIFYNFHPIDTIYSYEVRYGCYYGDPPILDRRYFSVSKGDTVQQYGITFTTFKVTDGKDALEIPIGMKNNNFYFYKDEHKSALDSITYATPLTSKIEMYPLNKYYEISLHFSTRNTDVEYKDSPYYTLELSFTPKRKKPFRRWVFSSMYLAEDFGLSFIMKKGKLLYGNYEWQNGDGEL